MIKAGLLLLDNNDVAIGPTFGGRYYLFGLSRLLPGIFEGVHWESNDFYEDEVDAAVGDLLTALEPMIILFLGIVVGGVVISMYMPLFSLIGKLAGSS